MGHTKRRHNPQLKARTTRSSRGRLLSLSDPAQTSQQLNDQLRQLGLYAAPTLGDGNCLFRALSDQLYGTDSKHAQLRQDICDWIYKHKARYEPFVEDERGIDTHLSCMRENATYGGHMELSAFAHMAKRNVKVVQPGLVYVIEWQAFAVSQSPTSSEAPTGHTLPGGGGSGPGSNSPRLPDKEFDGDYDDHQQQRHQAEDDDEAYSTIYVAYHDWEHFSSIRNLKGPHVGLPRVKERLAPSGSSVADVSASPIAEEYKPAKDRKKAEKERERERKERKREQARAKTKSKPSLNTAASHKGKEKADQDHEDVDYIDDEDDADLVETGTGEEDPVSPEKLKIKLKLTLNSNPSSANISESENNARSTSTPQKSGLKLRLPPSRSLSVTPSVASTPPTSQASTTSVASSSASSTATLPITTTAHPQPSTSPPATMPSSSSAAATAADYASAYAQLPHAHPPTHTSAPHLTDEYNSYSDYSAHHLSSSPSAHPSAPTNSYRTNRSPKRTFDETELEDGSNGSSGGNGNGSGRASTRSRLRGPEEFEGSKFEDVMMSSVSDIANEPAREGTVEREREEREVAELVDPAAPSTVREPLASSNGQTNTRGGGNTGGGGGGEEAYESDISTPSSLSSLEPSQGEEEHNEGTGTPTTSISNSSSPPSHPPAPPPPLPADSQKTPIASTPSKKIPVKSQQPKLAGRSVITRQQKREMALGLAAAEAINGGGEAGNGNMRLTRRMRKQLGLPKLRRMGGPYDRKKKGGQKDAGGGEEEWRRNGTGRVDVRGFRELRI